MNAELITGPSVWNRDAVAADDSWLHIITDRQAAELLSAVAAWRAQGITSLDRVGSAAALLPALLPLMTEVREELRGRGFTLIRGIPTVEMSDAEAALVFWCIGTLLGEGATQNAAGDLLCPVTDMNVAFDYGSKTVVNARGYQSNAEARFHCDPTDVVALMCMRTARSGGQSAIVSSHSVYNELLRLQPELLDRLSEGFAYDRKGENMIGEDEVSAPIPVFSRHDETLRVRYARSYIEGAIRKTSGVQQTALLDAFDAIAQREDLVAKMTFMPGDIQLLNNFSVLHARGAYEDFPELERRRFLWRQWLFINDEPWKNADTVMRFEFARFGHLGRTLPQWRAMETAAR